MIGRIILLTYADARYATGQKRLAASARAAGFDAVICAGPEAWAGTDFAAANHAILSQPRGGGYWLWKPWLIREELRKLEADDVLVYCDAGPDGYYAFDRLPTALLRRLTEGDRSFLIGPLLRQHGPLSRWTKRDALVLLDADLPELINQPCVQASPNFWRPRADAFELLDAWIAAACDPRILTDQPNTLGLPNYPDFVEHRHDQAILSILVHRDRLPALDFNDSGIFNAMALRPQALMTHRFLKSPANIERLAAGENAWLRFWSAAIFERLARALRAGRGS